VPTTQTYAIQDDSGELYDATPMHHSEETSSNVAVRALLDSAHQARLQGDLEVAVSKLERAVRIEPRNGFTWHELAWVRYQQQQTPLAISLAKKSNLLAEKNTQLQVSNWLLISESHEALGNRVKAEQARAHASRLQR
jgi:tetratricopeptide (TPR) repeat protein